MNKRLQFTGGEPDVRLDQILFGADANYDALQAIMLPYMVGSRPNYIISGCVVTVGGVAPSNTWSIAAGYVYINGEILQVDTDSGVFDSGSDLLAIAKSTTYRVDGDKTFIDSTARQTLQQNRGTVTVKGSLAPIIEVDAINGDSLTDKIARANNDSIKTAVINKRAGGMGLISGRKAFQRPMEDGVKLLNLIQDVYLTKEVTIA